MQGLGPGEGDWVVTIVLDSAFYQDNIISWASKRFGKNQPTLII